MFRRFLFPATGVLALVGMFGVPGQLPAQHSRGGSHHGFPSGSRVHPGFRRDFTPGFGFDPGRRGVFFDPRFNRARFDRFEDRFENRFGFGGFDRFEDRLENRFRFGPFDRRFDFDRDDFRRFDRRFDRRRFSNQGFGGSPR